MRADISWRCAARPQSERCRAPPMPPADALPAGARIARHRSGCALAARSHAAKTVAGVAREHALTTLFQHFRATRSTNGCAGQVPVARALVYHLETVERIDALGRGARLRVFWEFKGDPCSRLPTSGI